MTSQLPPAVNPANKPEKSKTDRKRIPMGVPQQRLQVPPIAGYHLYWFIESRVAQALQQCWEFVDSSEVDINQLNVATDKSLTGNADMGSRVMVVTGERGGKPEHLVLMKLKEEWHQEDLQAAGQTNTQVLDAIRAKQPIVDGNEKPSDARARYVKTTELQTHTRGNRRPNG